LLEEIATSIFVFVCNVKDFFQQFYFKVMPAGTEGTVSQDLKSFTLSQVLYLQCFYRAVEGVLQT